MPPMEVVWDWAGRSKAPRIPDALKPLLVSILQDKYLENHWSLREVCDYIKNKYFPTITKRQLSRLLEKHDMQRKRHPHATHVPDDLERSTSSATTSTDHSRLEDFHSMRSVISRASATSPEQTSARQFSSLGHRSESAQTLWSAQAPEETCAQKADQANLVRSESSCKDYQSTESGTRNEASTHDHIEHTIRNTASSHSLTQNSGSGRPAEPLATRALDRLCNGTMQEVRALHKLCGDSYQPSNIYGPSDRLQYDGEHGSPRDAVVGMTDRLGAATDVTSKGKARAILGAFIDSSSWDPDLEDMSDTELRSSLRLAIVMWCCGRTDDASHCLEFLFWRWHAKGAHLDTEPDPAARTDAFLNLTNVFMWLLQTDRCNLAEGVSFRLWELYWEAQRSRRQLSSNGDALTLQQLLVIGRLALTAHSRGYQLLFEKLREFWRLHHGAYLTTNLCKDRLHPWQVFFRYVDRQVTTPQLTPPIRPPVVPHRSTVKAGVEKLVRWVREQLLSPSDVWPGEVTRLAERCVHLEQQLLLSYLFHQGFESNVAWNLWLDDMDHEILPCSLALEWLLGEVPFLSLSVLSSLIRFKDEWPPASTSSTKWCGRMLMAVDELLEDIGGTTARFCHDAWAACSNPVRNRQSDQGTAWVSPIQFDSSDNSAISGGLTRHLICSIALFGSAVPGTAPRHKLTSADAHVREQAAGLRSEHCDPSWSCTPRPLSDGFESMKSFFQHARDYMNPNRTSVSTHSSRSLQRLSRARSSVTRSVVDTWMYGTQGPLITSPWSIVNHGRRDEIVSMMPDEDPMDLNA